MRSEFPTNRQYVTMINRLYDKLIKVDLIKEGNFYRLPDEYVELGEVIESSYKALKKFDQSNVSRETNS